MRCFDDEVCEYEVLWLGFQGSDGNGSIHGGGM
jgi:hypothetical protein